MFTSKFSDSIVIRIIAVIKDTDNFVFKLKLAIS